jgi:hypothetical protein
MANTPNYGWETPDDTDYVYQGAAAARTTANAIDTTMATMVPKSGALMTGTLTVPTITAAGRSVGILAETVNGNSILQFLDNPGTSQTGSLVVNVSNILYLNLTANGNSLAMNSIGETTRTHNGVTRPMPFAQQAGAISIGASTSATVTLASGRFTVTPHVFITPFQNTSPGVVVTGKVSSASAGAIEITNTTSSIVVFYWQAIQMTSTTASG